MSSAMRNPIRIRIVRTMTPNTFTRSRDELQLLEGLTGGAALEDDDRDDQDPPGQRVEARNDQQDQPEDHSERGQTPATMIAISCGRTPANVSPKERSGAAVTDVVDGFDQRALEPERQRSGTPAPRGSLRPSCPGATRQDEADQPDGDIDDKRDRQQVLPGPCTWPTLRPHLASGSWRDLTPIARGGPDRVDDLVELPVLRQAGDGAGGAQRLHLARVRGRRQADDRDVRTCLPSTAVALTPSRPGRR